MNILDYTFDKYCNGQCEILDAHCHVKQAENFKLICFGLLPSGYPIDKESENEDIKVGLGFHPWACSNAEDIELDVFKQFLSETKFIGEIGLDFGDKHVEFKEKQIEVFTKICEMLSHEKDKVISIHAVKSATEVMDILERSGASKNNIVIMHWFSGSGEELRRAIDAGYYFSVGPKMLATGRGHEYIRQIPEERMFIETDLPWDAQEFSAEDHYNLLNDFAMQLREVKEY